MDCARMRSKSNGNLKDLLMSKDYASLIIDSATHTSTIFASRVAETADWMTLWDKAMDHGPQGTTIIQSLFKMTRPIFGLKPCPFCDETQFYNY
jgi:hypothetical protein